MGAAEETDEPVSVLATVSSRPETVRTATVLSSRTVTVISTAASVRLIGSSVGKVRKKRTARHRIREAFGRFNRSGGRELFPGLVFGHVLFLFGKHQLQAHTGKGFGRGLIGKISDRAFQ